jgi:hypothetical protein
MSMRKRQREVDSVAIESLVRSGFQVELFADGWMVGWPDGRSVTFCLLGCVCNFVARVAVGQTPSNRWWEGQAGKWHDHPVPCPHGLDSN